jgi:phage tail sheath protein FI
MVTLTYPGVYVVEEPSGVRPIAGASTSIGMFIGRARKGPINRPVRLTNLTEFSRTFGDDNSVSDMARYVRMFFTNGGSDTWIMRIANGATSAAVTLSAEDTTPIVTLTAKAAGASGEEIRAVITYPAEEPEGRFNLELFRWAPNSAGITVASEREVFQNLTMNANDPLYAPAFVSQESALVTLAELGNPAADAVNGSSRSGRFFLRDTVANAQIALTTVFNALAGQPGGTHLRISVDGLMYVEANLTPMAAAIAGFGGTIDDLVNNVVLQGIADGITAAYAAAGFPGIAVDVTEVNGVDVGGIPTRFIAITSQNSGDIKIRPATQGKDIAVPLMLGPGQGGLEVGAHAHRRPAPNGVQVKFDTTGRINAVAFAQKNTIDEVFVDGFDANGVAGAQQINVPPTVTVNDNEPIFTDTYAGSQTGNSDGLRQKLGQIRDAVNVANDSEPLRFPWRASQTGLRLTLTSTAVADLVVPALTTGPTDWAAIAGAITTDVRQFRVGASGTAGSQIPAPLVASDGAMPLPGDYNSAFAIIDQEVRAFNLMVLPPDREQVQDMQPILGPATAFCRQRRAFLFADPPGNLTPQEMSTAVDAMRIGIARDYAAVFYPRILINEGGSDIAIGAAGAMAGLAARTDATRGVYKAPAGQDLPIFGVTGVQRELSNGEVGMLNPVGVNCITRAPAGIRPWGSRTLDGADAFASEWKYIPVRRTALFIEQSLFDGLQWVIFEPNGDILWSQIRLNVGAFMGRLFRQNFFKGEKKSDAYFVKCDAETTTQADIDVGVVNLWVGFAPLKPAEFLVIHLQQMAGQSET